MLNLGKRWTIIVVYLFAFVLSLNGYVLAENLLDAANEGNLQKVTRMVEDGSNVNITNDMGVTPLHFAAVRGHKEVAEFLISKGADVNSQTEFGQTPLFWAAMKGKCDVIELLISKGSNVDTKDHKDRTPLAWACYGGYGKQVYVKCAEILIQNGADVNNVDEDGLSILSYPTSGNKGCTEMLLKHGAHK